MKTRWIILCLFLSLAGCSSKVAKKGEETQSQPSASGEAPVLTVSMQGLKESMEKLLPVLVDPRAFGEPSRQKELGKQIASLADIAGKVSHSPIKAKMDPSFAFLSEGFTDELNRASEAFAIGKSEYARYSLLNVTSYCIECHTRTTSGPSFNNTDLDRKLAELKPLDRGEYLLATRRFDQALQEFLQVIESKDNRYGFLDFDRALRYAMSIAVKYKEDPAKTEMIIEKVKKSPKVPFYLKQASLTWSQAVREWRAERNRKRPPSINERLHRAEALIKKGRQAQIGISDRSGDVYLLRALSMLHQIVLADLNKNQLGRALFLTGQGYEMVRDLAIWSLHENYFETCIRRVPHSSWSMSCYKALEESLVIGFTGSSGTKIPYDVQVRLTELGKLARPEAPTTTQ